jgi:2-dehydro-3-deoxyphosphogluconate aldolase / (4S)-4-hydroxy-2-oxoglutarate aldolase
MNIVEFKKLPILGILRNTELSATEDIVDCAASAGLKAIEFTMNTHGACDIIKRACACAGKRISIGAGTVLSLSQAKQAVDAGAEFLVAPCIIDDVIDFCLQNAMPVFPGALTPTEIYSAHKKGASMVKLFPAALFNTEYLKAIKGPFNNIELLVCGGINNDNIKEYFTAGASAVAFGESIFRKNLLKAGDFQAIERSIKALIAAKEN